MKIRWLEIVLYLNLRLLDFPVSQRLFCKDASFKFYIQESAGLVLTHSVCHGPAFRVTTFSLWLVMCGYTNFVSLAQFSWASDFTHQYLWLSLLFWSTVSFLSHVWVSKINLWTTGICADFSHKLDHFHFTLMNLISSLCALPTSPFHFRPVNDYHLQL